MNHRCSFHNGPSVKKIPKRHFSSVSSLFWMMINLYLSLRILDLSIMPPKAVACHQKQNLLAPHWHSCYLQLWPLETRPCNNREHSSCNICTELRRLYADAWNWSTVDTHNYRWLEIGAVLWWINHFINWLFGTIWRHLTWWKIRRPIEHKTINAIRKETHRRP